VQEINAQLKRTAAIEPGILRTSANIGVHTKQGLYVPPVPDAAELSAIVAHAASSEGNLLDASTLFIKLAKAQPFGDGNKRSALLAANGLLIKNHSDEILFVPTEQPGVDTFNTMLTQWYLHDDISVGDWLVGFSAGHAF
jgi:Fic family protein